MGFMDDGIFVIIEVLNIGLAVGLFIFGHHIGKKSKNEQLEQFIRALNIDRWLDGRTEGNPKLFVEKGVVKGQKTETVSITANIRFVDWERKKMITTGEGERDLTPEEIEEFKNKPPYKKTPI